MFGAFLRLGLTAFGGPVAHIGYFREEFVARRRWLDEAAYADLVALCQFLPGPASSQVGIALGLMRGGLGGAAAAWVAFTLPSALLMALAALGIGWLSGAGGLTAEALSGLKAAAVAEVAVALWSMARSLTPDAPRATIAVAAAALVTLWGAAAAQMVAIGLGAVAGLALVRPDVRPAAARIPLPIGRRTAAAALGLFLALLGGLPLLGGPHLLDLFGAFYRAGALVFGGGHVVLPLLQAEVVAPGWVTPESFLAGYGLAQAVPGPLFTFAAYLGMASDGWTGAAVALLAIFLPAWLLVFAALPFWSTLRAHARAQAALAGVNAAVVGLLAAAFYHPVVTAGVRGPLDFVLVLAALLLLVAWKLPPWLVVAVVGMAGIWL
ncbi:chromate efflux transporter [Caenispirillum bisanense]